MILAQWFGITGDTDLTEVLPNRGVFSGIGFSLLSASEIFSILSLRRSCNASRVVTTYQIIVLARKKDVGFISL